MIAHDPPMTGKAVEVPLARLLPQLPPKAAGFIVTVYGDIVEPRGGVLWMGTLIEVCRDFGVSESLVRTAVSRLVAAGRLIGEREGRRSFYRLSPQAQTEFGAAARTLFGPSAPPEGWLLGAGGPEAGAPAGWADMGGGIRVGPDRDDLPRPGGLLFRARLIRGEDDLPAFAARLWPVAEYAAAYADFVERFAPLEAEIEGGGQIDGRAALVARLALVHQFRSVVLRDPRLPLAALPPDWRGMRARRLFDRLYLLLAAPADSAVGARFRSARGLLPAETAATRRRLEALAADLAHTGG